MRGREREGIVAERLWREAQEREAAIGGLCRELSGELDAVKDCRVPLQRFVEDSPRIVETLCGLHSLRAGFYAEMDAEGLDVLRIVRDPNLRDRVTVELSFMVFCSRTTEDIIDRRGEEALDRVADALERELRKLAPGLEVCSEVEIGYEDVVFYVELEVPCSEVERAAEVVRIVAEAYPRLVEALKRALEEHLPECREN